MEITGTIENKRIQSRFTRAMDSYDQHAGAQHRICRKLAALLPEYAGTRFERILEIGCGTGGFTQCLQQHCNISEWVLNDLCECCREKTSKLFPDNLPRFITGDAEETAFPGRFDLIASASAFQWMKQPERFVGKLAEILRPEGTLLFSTFAPGNLQEIKELTGKGLDYPDAGLWVRWLEKEFRLLYREEETIRLSFAHPLDVLRHMKNTGVTATGNGHWTRGQQETFCHEYTERFSTTNNQVALTYRPLYLLAVKK